MARALNDRIVKSLKPAPEGQTYLERDGVVPGLWVRVTDKGTKAFVLVARYPGTPVSPETGKRNPVPRALGKYGALTLAEARDKARHWIELIQQGKDPQEEKDRQLADAARQRSNTFRAVAERYIAEQLAGQRRAKVSEREIRKDVIAAWGDRPVSTIAPADIKALINRIKGHAPYQARNVFGHLGTLFRWAVHQDLIDVSPAASLSQKWLLEGAKIGPRQRVLNEQEIAAFWRAAGRLSYPAGPFYKLLLLTGVRMNELAQAKWSEFHPEIRRLIREAEQTGQQVEWSKIDDGVKCWTIPRERFKSDSEHVVQLSNDALSILASLPRFDRCDWLLTCDGKNRAWIGGKYKQRLDDRMLSAMRAVARKHGDNPDDVKLTPWVNHDIRRVLRSHLSALDVPDHVAEMAIGHGRKGLQRIYDQHRHERQIRNAMERWAARLRSIVEPQPTNVVRLQVAR
jgi:integrase